VKFPAKQGLARSEPDATPIGEAIEEFHRREDLSSGIPAHRSPDGDAAVRGRGRSRRDAVPNGSTENVHVAMMTAVRMTTIS